MTVCIIIHIYITVDNSEFQAYQQKQVNGPHLDPLCLISSVGVPPQNQRQYEYKSGEDSPQCLQASSRLNLKSTKGWLFMHAMCNFNCVFFVCRTGSVGAHVIFLYICIRALTYFMRKYTVMWPFNGLSCAEKQGSAQVYTPPTCSSGYLVLFMSGLYHMQT